MSGCLSCHFVLGDGGRSIFNPQSGRVSGNKRLSGSGSQCLLVGLGAKLRPPWACEPWFPCPWCGKAVDSRRPVAEQARFGARGHARPSSVPWRGLRRWRKPSTRAQLPVCAVRFVTIDGQVCGRAKASAPRLRSPSSYPAGCGP